MVGALSHLHRAGSQDTSTLENKWVLIKSGDENKTLIFPFILHASSEVTWLYQIKPQHKIKRNIWRGVLGFIGLQSMRTHHCRFQRLLLLNPGIIYYFEISQSKVLLIEVIKPEDNPKKGESKPRSVLSVLPQSPGQLKAIYKNIESKPLFTQITQHYSQHVIRFCLLLIDWLIFFRDRISLCETSFVDQTALKLPEILLPLPLKCWVKGVRHHQPAQCIF